MVDVKSGFKSFEFYLGMAAIAAKIIWKDFPDEAFGTIGAYVVARQAQKGFGFYSDVSGRPSWKTSEFWATTFFAIVKSVFPDLPEESMLMVLGWIGARTGVKITASVKAEKNGVSPVV